MFNFKSLFEMLRWEALLVVLVLIAGMGYTITSLDWLPCMSIVIAISMLLAYGPCRGLKYGDMQSGMVGAVRQGMGAVYLFPSIELMISALMMSGAVPTLMYYGFGLISPTYFYFSVFALCSVIGVAIGSSLTTCITTDVAFIGMGAALHADLATATGVIVSDVFFGDKMSPLLDTTSIVASTVGIDLFEHIESITCTIIPARVASTVLILWLLPNVAASDLNSVDIFRIQLEATDLAHTYSLAPFGLLVALALIRVNVVVTMLFIIAAAPAVTYFRSIPDSQQLDAWFYSGYELEGGVFRDITKLTSRSGLESILFTQIIMILGMSLGGLLFIVGVIPSLLGAVRTLLSNVGRATLSVAATSVGANFFIGERYLNILPVDEAFRPVCDKLGLYSRNLSHTLEDADAVVNPLVPRSVCGVFINHALDVPVWEYLPYAFFYYLYPVLTLLFGWIGFTLTKK